MIDGLDVHRQQITFGYVDSDGLVRWGQIRPATRKTLWGWLAEHCPTVMRSSRWRVAPGGGMWKSCALRDSGRIWVIRPRSRCCGVRRNRPRLTVRLRGCLDEAVGGQLDELLPRCLAGDAQHGRDVGRRLRAARLQQHQEALAGRAGRGADCFKGFSWHGSSPGQFSKSSLVKL